jgi:hypothetical protein
VIELAVTLLQVDAAPDRLRVTHPRFRFHAHDEPEAGDGRVPRPCITPDWQGNLRTPPQLWVDPCAQPFQELYVGDVADWISVREEAKHGLQTNDRAQTSDHQQADLRRDATLDPRHSWMRYTGRGCDGALAQPRGLAGLAKFSGSGGHQQRDGPVRSINGPVPGRHGRDLETLPLAGGYSTAAVHWMNQATIGIAGRVQFARFGSAGEPVRT